MLRLSRKTLLALEAVIDIAFNARPEPVQAKEITARQGVPHKMPSLGIMVEVPSVAIAPQAFAKVAFFSIG